MAVSNRRVSHVLLCNGAEPPQRLRGSRRRPGEVVETSPLDTFGPNKNVRLTVADITDTMGGRLPAEVVDLLEVATLVYAADQYCRRTPGKRVEYGARWRRLLRFHVAVRRPDFWARAEVYDDLVRTLHFLSDDDYEFHFCQMGRPPSVQDYLEYDARSAVAASFPVDRVMLMSGGLDSLAGAAEQVLRHGRRVAMVSHRPVGHMDARQRRLVQALGERSKGSGLVPFHVGVTVNKMGLEEHDATQRSRSFLYASLAAAVAHLFGLSEIWFYENGIVSVNLPLCGQEVGGRATRTTHPQVLRGFERIFGHVFERAFTVANGFFWHTKQDVLEVLARLGHADLAKTSVSCVHTRRASHPPPHCGMCSQCLSRRVAALGAGYDGNDPPAGYRTDPLTGARHRDEERILAERFVGHARQVVRMTAVQQFDRKYAGELARVYPYLNMPLNVAAEKLHDLHRRHADQVGRAMVPELQANVGHHWEGVLPDSSAIAYAFGGGVSVARKRAPAPAEATVADPQPQPVGASERNGFHVDEETFTVWMGSASHTFRQRTKLLFTLLTRLARRVGTPVPYAQLRGPGGVWDDHRVEDVTIRGAVTRLKKELTDGGLRLLADAISTGTFDKRQYALLDLTAAGDDGAV